MPTRSYLEKLNNAPAASFHVLDPLKAARMKAKTMFIPSPVDVANAIAAIPRGETRTIAEIRRALAEGGRAEMACPSRTVKYWKWIAHAAGEIGGGKSVYAVPW